MTKLQEELAKLRNSFQLIDGLAAAIDSEPRNTPDSRHKARHIQRKADEIFGTLTEIFKMPTQADIAKAIVDKNAHLGAVELTAGKDQQ